MIERLTTLAILKDWLDIPEDNTDSDALLTRMIVAASQYALNYMSRDTFAAMDFVEDFRGNGKTYQLMRNWPIISVASVGSFGQAIQPAESTGLGNWRNGFRIGQRRGAPQTIDLYGWVFAYTAPCQVVYRAGYEILDEQLIPTPPVTDPVATYATITPTAGGQWLADQGVKIDGVTATKVDVSDTPPATGEYAVTEWGEYHFALADIGKTALIFYSFCPMEVSQAVTELIGEWFKRKDRIGLLSKTLGGQETVTFSQKDMSDSIRTTFDYYSNVVPF